MRLLRRRRCSQRWSTGCVRPRPRRCSVRFGGGKGGEGGGRAREEREGEQKKGEVVVAVGEKKTEPRKKPNSHRELRPQVVEQHGHGNCPGRVKIAQEPLGLAFLLVVLRSWRRERSCERGDESMRKRARGQTFLGRTFFSSHFCAPHSPGSWPRFSSPTASEANREALASSGKLDEARDGAERDSRGEEKG